jgi:hypothetical protein
MGSAGNKIGGVSEHQATRGASRYDTLIATLVGFFALCISCYTAYMQRQQVRAMVWPILEFDSANDPDIHLTLANKGVGPAIIRHAVVKVNDKPVKTWGDAFAKIAGNMKPSFSESDMSGRVLSAGESMVIFRPHDADNKPIAFDKSNPAYVKWNEHRRDISVEICYSSTLGDCWILRGVGNAPNVTTPVRSCPRTSAMSFTE